MSGARLWSPHKSPLPQRIKCMSGFDSETGCWPWLARTNKGYGLITVDCATQWAHRASYEAFVGPIPGEMTVDHLCFNTSCVNPEHLRLLSNAENARNQRLTCALFCKRGHEFTPENTIRERRHTGTGSAYQRRCRECTRAKQRVGSSRTGGAA